MTPKVYSTIKPVFIFAVVFSITLSGYSQSIDNKSADFVKKLNSVVSSKIEEINKYNSKFKNTISNFKKSRAFSPINLDCIRSTKFSKIKNNYNAQIESLNTIINFIRSKAFTGQKTVFDNTFRLAQKKFAETKMERVMLILADTVPWSIICPIPFYQEKTM